MCSHITPLSDTTSTTPEVMTVLYFMSTPMPSNRHLKIRWNVVIYQADEKKKVLQFLLGTSHSIVIHTQKTPSVTCKTLIIFPLFGAVNSKQHTINTIYMWELASFFLMKPVFIQSWIIPRKYLRSANLPIAMSQMAAMKISQFLPRNAHSTRNNDAFTHCGISLISPNTLHRKCSSSLKSFMFL